MNKKEAEKLVKKLRKAGILATALKHLQGGWIVTETGTARGQTAPRTWTAPKDPAAVHNKAYALEQCALDAIVEAALAFTAADAGQYKAGHGTPEAASAWDRLLLAVSMADKKVLDRADKGLANLNEIARRNLQVAIKAAQDKAQGLPGDAYQAVIDYLETIRNSAGNCLDATTREIFEALKERRAIPAPDAYQVQDPDAWGLDYTRAILNTLCARGIVRGIKGISRGISWGVKDGWKQKINPCNGLRA